MNRRLIALSLVALTMPAFARPPVTFSDGHAVAPLPDSFEIRSADEDLVATFGAKGDHQLQLSLLKDLSSIGGQNLAVNFVNVQGQKKGIKVASDGERAVLMEAGERTSKGGKDFQSAHWQIAVGNCLFTMTVTAPLPMSKELDAFLGDPLNDLVNGLACR